MILELILAAVGVGALIFKSSEKQTQRTYKTPILTPQKTNFSAPDITKRKILDMARARGIKYLVHFTRQENLPSIKTYGLMSRRNLENFALPFNFNDGQRLDGCPNSISLSVTSTNYKMFWSLRQENPSVEWAIILLDAYGVLKNYDCAFQAANAAAKTVRNIPIAERKTPAAFEAMFYDDNLRKIRGLKDNEPTNPQAEILCFDTISPKFFKGILFNGELFAPRHDYRHWKKNDNELELW